MKANDFGNILLTLSTPVVKAIEVIDNGGMQIAFVVTADHQLLGSVTDGDVRRGLLRGIGLAEPVERIMNPEPTTASLATSKHEILELMREKSLRHIPVVDLNGRLMGVETLESILIENEHKPNRVVLMAGGQGKRLFPLTKDCPKPLLKVGAKPILHTIVDGFVAQGFKNFFISVNYKADMVESYFGDGRQMGAQIEYLREEDHLGTAGSLSLLPTDGNEPVIVMNGDLLTKVNFSQLLHFHRLHEADATVCVREYDFQVPYGVVQVNGEVIQRIDEKPVQSFFVNAGIYVFNPGLIGALRKGAHIDMTDLINHLMREDRKVVAFPLREFWLDIGQADDFERAHHEYAREFAGESLTRNLTEN